MYAHIHTHIAIILLYKKTLELNLHVSISCSRLVMSHFTEIEQD